MDKPQDASEPTSAAPSNEERRQAAKAKLEQRLEHEHQQARRRKIIIASVSTAVVVAVVATVTTIVVKNILDDREAARWTSCTYAAAENPLDNLPKTVPANVPADQRANYQKQIDEAQRQAAQARPLERTSPKPDAKQLKSGTAAWQLNTSQGLIPITLDRAGAPCNTDAIIALTQNKAALKSNPKVTFNSFFDQTSCGRMTTSKTLNVLQCGDPTKIGVGGPGWSSPDEPPTDLKPSPSQNPMAGDQNVIYPRGTVAVYNRNNPQSGSANTGGSQFFIVISDSQLPANYSVIGKVDDAGLKVLDKVSKAGVVPTSPDQPGEGAPKLPVDIKTATIS
ncbi:peptidylprolyl isomerase [Gordonia effusa]|uniref:peptidylprolyl isomerase n=1 Tax=Gordonia effusa TaxID=263908 RepID=UPI000682C177|nr:peptidylprolyl isomerase [Gordonia effusa]